MTRASELKSPPRAARVVAGIIIVLAAFSTFCAEQKAAVRGNVPAAPTFSVPGGVFTNRVSLRMAAEYKEIRYTLDGSEPNEKSPLCSSALRITTSCVVKAKAFDPKAGPSATVAQSYILLAPELLEFSSNLPLVILNTFGEEIAHETKAQVSMRFIDVGKGRSSLTGPADFDGRGRINVRGYTSLRYPKRSFQLKTRDGSDKPLKASLLGFLNESDWILYAPYPDKTLMRDVLAYELSNQMGRYAPRTRFVEVFVNSSGGKLTMRHYAGVYVFEEKIKRDEHRVDIDKLTPEDKTEPNITGGYIFKKDHTEPVNLGSPNNNGGGFQMFRGGGSSHSGYQSGPGGFPASSEGFLPSRLNEPGFRAFFQSARERSSSTPDGFTTTQGNEFTHVDPEVDEITPAQKLWLRRHLNQFEKALYGPNFKDPKQGYAAYIDPDSFIDHHLLVEVTKNIDGFRFSTFFHKDRGGKIKMGPIWDWNLSFGNANGKQGYKPQYWYWPQLDDQQYSWFRRLFDDPDFGQRYVDRWGQLRTNMFATSSLLGRIDQWAAHLNEAQSRNFRRWPVLGQSVWPNYYVGNSYEDEVKWMKQWIRTRIAWINKQFPSSPMLSLPGGPVKSRTSLIMQAPEGEIHYTLDGSDPRAAGGGLSPRALQYSAAIVLQEKAQVFARVRLGDRWSSPSATRYSIQGASTPGPRK